MTAVTAAVNPTNTSFRAAGVVLRAAVGLLVHAMTRPGRPATICRRTGRVAAR